MVLRPRCLRRTRWTVFDRRVWAHSLCPVPCVALQRRARREVHLLSSERQVLAGFGRSAFRTQRVGHFQFEDLDRDCARGAREVHDCPEAKGACE